LTLETPGRCAKGRHPYTAAVADVPLIDPRRLAAVRRSGLLDTERESVFDELARAAARLIDAPYAFVTVADERRSFWKAAHGIPDGTRANAIGDSFCQYVIASRDDLLVDDARLDPLTCDNASIESMGVVAWAGCPLWFDGEVLGSFCVVDVRPRSWSEHDRDVLRLFSARASDLITLSPDERLGVRPENGQLETLRASLRPPALPLDLAFDFAAWSCSADDGHGFLGDFYDVHPTRSGGWCVVLGDVCGHGPDAAKFTTTLRYHVARLAPQHDDPVAMLEELDPAIDTEDFDDNRFATICVAMLNRRDGPVEALVASAGHPPPLVRTADGAAAAIALRPGPPIGLLAGVGFQATSVSLLPGDTLLLFSDGATESRDGDGNLLGEEGLAVVVAAGPGGGAKALVGHVAASVIRHGGGRARDDIALLAANVQA
jgi:phosphoserine phosphatase RsbU/P